MGKLHFTQVGENGKIPKISQRALLQLASSRIDATIRITGGAALMSPQEGKDVANLLAQALGGKNCQASVLAGGTMVVPRPKQGWCANCDERRIHCTKHDVQAARHPGVMDALGRLAQLKASARLIGIVPSINDIEHLESWVVITDDRDEDYYTVVDSGIPVSVVAQFSTDKPKLTWDDEWRICLEYMDLLRTEAGQKTLHVVYNGGDTTTNEIRKVASLPSYTESPWHMLLVEDSGRIATELANNTSWRKQHPQVQSCKKAELDTVVRELGFAPAL